MKYSREILDKLDSVTAKRPKTVIQHILEHGYVTTEELETLYGYKHAPRAARDVREQGIPLKMYRVKSSDGRSIGAYRFGDLSRIGDSISKENGRTVLSKALKSALIEKYGSKCFIYSQPLDERLLQIDHRIPYEIGGEQNDNIEHYMLLSPSANRAKSWTCEHCPNWEKKDPSFCVGCFWAYPETHTHIAGKQQRQIIVSFTGNEIEDYNGLINLVGTENAELTIKQLIHQYLPTEADCKTIQ
ncbi:MAG: HNH endonuclease [Bacteroidales bacterium]|nr:HNH endonuclease [Bacteroidales bacterium]